MSWFTANSFRLVCLWLPVAAICAIEIDKISRVDLKVLSPLNNSITGKFAEVRFQLDFYNAANMRVNPPFAEYTLEVTENGLSEHATVLPNFSPWVSVGYGPFGGEGLRNIAFKMTIVSKISDEHPQTFVAMSSVAINIVPNSYQKTVLLNSRSMEDQHNHDVLENDNKILNDLLASLKPHHKELAITAALALDNRNMAFESVVTLSPQIMEFFDWSTYSDDCAAIPELKFGPLFSSWQNVHKDTDLQYRAYYDVTVVSFVSNNSVSADSQQLEAMTRYLYAMKLRTNGHLVLIVNGLLFSLLIATSEVLYGNSFFLTENIEQQSVQKRVYSYEVDYDAFLNHESVLADVSVSGGPTKVTASIGAHESISLHSSQRQSVVRTSGSYRELQNGVNYVNLRNGCIQSEGKLVALTPEDYAGPVVDHLDLDSLNEFLDRAGFMPFTRVRQAVAYGGDNVLFVNASAAVVIPFYHNNVFHHFQSLAGLLTLQDAFPEELKFLLMPRYDSTADNQYEWSNGVLSLVTQYYEKQLRKTQPGAEGLSVLFQPQFKSLFQQGNVELVCFRDMVAIGQVDTNRGFFTNSSVLGQFRDVSYDTYARDKKTTCSAAVAAAQAAAKASAVTAAAPLTPDPIAPRTNYELPQFHKTNKYRIRVTFSLRLHNRRILNLAALHEALVSTGMVDMDWLNHLKQTAPVVEGKGERDGEVLFNVHSGWTYLDNMSLQDQIKIFKETDLFIGVHGSAFINAALFMQPNSVCIALMQSRHIEFVLPQIIHQAGIMFHFLPVLDQNQSTNCVSDIAPDCLSGSLTRAGRMDCLSIRNCDVSVDPHWFSTLVEFSAYHIRANKRIDSWVV